MTARKPRLFALGSSHDYGERIAGRLEMALSWTFRKKLNYFIDTITGFSVVPIRFFSMVGAVVAVLSFIYGLDIIIGGLLGLIDVRGYATLVTLISFFSGLIMLMLGIIGEYLWRVFDAVTHKPESVLEQEWL